MPAVRGKRPLCPGPQSCAVIKYLESLAKKIDVSQMDHPCSNHAPVAFYSDYREPEAKKCPRLSGDTSGDTLRKYFVKK